MSIDARDLSEAISAMDSARIFMEQRCEVGGGRIDHMIRLEGASRSLKISLQCIKLSINDTQLPAVNQTESETQPHQKPKEQ